MKSKRRKQKNQTNDKQRSLQNTMENVQEKEHASAEKDGFRYDYDDSSDLN